MEDYEIDEFEKLYAVTVAETKSSLKFSNSFDEKEDFDKICSLAKFKQDHQEMFDEKNKDITDDDKNYYVIPTKVTYPMRLEKETVFVKRQAYLLIDATGNDIGLILENGAAVQEFGKNKANEQKSNKLSMENRNEAKEDIEQENEQENTIEDLDEEEELEEDNTVNSILDKESKNRIYDEAMLIGILPEVLDSIAKERNCRIDQINLRKIDDEELNEEITGLNLNMYREKIVAVRMQYGNTYQGYLVNSETGEFFRPPEGLEANRDEIPEVLDYFKYRFKSGVEESRSLRNDEGRSYITYLDENGNQKEMKYMYNGKEADMEKSARERYLAEVKKADEILQATIDEYQTADKNEKHDIWSKVKLAMQARVEIDRKYDVSKNQKEVTKNDLEETIDETIKKDKPEKDEGYDREEDLQSRSRDPRWG